MKNLKIKFGFFSLLAILAVSVFLTSCEQENINIVENVDLNISESKDAIKFILPETMNDKSQDEIIQFIQNLSKEEMEQLSETSSVNELEDRSCGSWSHYGWRCSSNYRVWVKIERRWCGPPSSGAYEYSGIYYWNSPC